MIIQKKSRKPWRRKYLTHLETSSDHLSVVKKVVVEEDEVVVVVKHAALAAEVVTVVVIHSL